VKKLCECGCGKPTPIAKQTDKRTGRVKGEPARFLHGHSARPPLAERFWEKVDKNGPLPSAEAIGIYPEIAGQQCWIYGKSSTAHRRSVALGGGYEQNAARVAWFLASGRWPEPCALHKCDVGSCVRFSHLFEGTLSENTRDMIRKKRDRIVGARHKLAKFTDDQVAEIRRIGAPWARSGRRRYRGTALLVRRLARRFGVGRGTIEMILKNEIYVADADTAQTAPPSWTSAPSPDAALLL